MANCPIACQTDLIGNPEGDCVLTPRYKTPSRVSFFTCATDLPDPISDAAMLALYEDGSIVLSSELANIVFAEPQYEDVLLSDCQVPQRIVASREMTFEDRIAITSGSPANPYFDYSFWKDKLNNQTKLNYIIHYCDGDSVIARDASGNLLTASITVYLDRQKLTNSPKSVEFKRGSIVFQGDPLDLGNVPEFNLFTAGIL